MPVGDKPMDRYDLGDIVLVAKKGKWLATRPRYVAFTSLTFV